ncbi:MAG: aminotransferase class I/II-fold pyridoxal phosphate-dependent enzyme, partial [Myxococcota bacterium]
MPEDFYRIQRLPPYTFQVVTDLKMKLRKQGEDIIDLGMGNPDLPPAPHIVDKLVEAARNPRNHRYSVSRGIYKLRVAIVDWYQRRFGASFDPDSEAIVTIGVKEGLSHLALSIMAPGDGVLVPSPTYPIHRYSVVVAGGHTIDVPLTSDTDFFENLREVHASAFPRPKFLILSFPHNPTTATVDLGFFERVIRFAKDNELLVIHDFAYSDLVFDGYRAPSILEVPGAREVAVEFTSVSKTYNMPGWRVGFCVGNQRMIAALSRLKSYLDYGIFTPIQVASIMALNGPQECVSETRAVYGRRRDTLVDGLEKAGWKIQKPRATMFVWAPLPEGWGGLGSIEFSTRLLREAKVAVSPGIGFGAHGDNGVRFA